MNRATVRLGVLLLAGVGVVAVLLALLWPFSSSGLSEGTGTSGVQVNRLSERDHELTDDDRDSFARTPATYMAKAARHRAAVAVPPA